MSEAVSNLYRVTVAIPSGRSWSVLVRAVDEESAAGAVRARGHHVVEVAVGEMPRKSAAAPRISCVNCGYLLKKLPVGAAGEVQCPECGVVNTPLAGSGSMWEEIKATRTEWKTQRQGRRQAAWASFTVRGFLLILGAIAIGALLIRPLLKWLGWAP